MDLFSLSFVYLFLPASLLLYYVTPHKLKNLCLLGISLVFYWLLEPVAILFMLGSLIFDFVLIQLLKYYETNLSMRMTVAAVSVAKTILGILLLSGETGFLLYVGVSVYLLTSMGYIIDAYDYKAPYETSFVNFALMCVFFGKIYVGPLVIYNQIMPQIKRRKPSLTNVSSGIIQFISGLAKKILLADNITLVFYDLRRIPMEDLSVVAVWSMIISLAFAMYFGLSAMCDMAQGIGKMFGLNLPKNFYYPYQAKTVTEFFGRFMMSLVDFIKRYVCFDLIGYSNYKLIGALQTLAVGVLFGLWFGLDLRFAIWGLYLAVFMVLEKFVYGKYLKKIPSVLSRVVSFGVVMLSFTIILSDTMAQFVFYIKAMFGLNLQNITSDTLLYIMNSNYIIIIVCFILCTSIVDNGLRFLEKQSPKLSDVLTVVFNIGLLVLSTAFML